MRPTSIYFLCVPAAILHLLPQGQKWVKPQWTDFYRQAFIKLVREIEEQGTGPVPVVAAVTFAAPMVGDKNYTRGFKGNTSQSPFGITLPPQGAAPDMWLYKTVDGKGAAGGGFMQQVEVAVRDTGLQMMKEVWFQAAKLLGGLGNGKVSRVRMDQIVVWTVSRVADSVCSSLFLSNKTTLTWP
jgi:hypothetical protein